MPARRATHFGPPAIRDLTAREEPPPPSTGLGPADLVFLSGEQLERCLAEIPEVRSLPSNIKPALLFIPWGSGALGVPFCPSPAPEEMTCTPVKGGLDDNPLAWTCSCRLDTPPRGEPGDPTEEPPPPCHLVVLTKHPRHPQVMCVKGSCKGECQRVKRKVGGLWKVACRCTRRPLPTP